MAKARQFGCLVQQLHADQFAALRRDELAGRGKSPQRHVGRRVGGIGGAAGQRVEPGADREAERAPNACAVRNSAPTLADLLTPSTPMPK